MNVKVRLLLVWLCVFPAAIVNCGDDDTQPIGASFDAGPTPQLDADPDVRAAPDGGGAVDGGAVNPRVDLLFVVDNSYLMNEKQASLGASVDALFRSLRATDIHVGMITTSFKLRDLCPFAAQDEKARLMNRVTRDPSKGIIPGSEAGFLSSGPGGTTERADLAARTSALILGAVDRGCGIEAQLEAVYRFVAEPDPSLSVTIDIATNLPVANGVDYQLLAQRKAFFRPDSTVAIVVLSDEDDSSIDQFSAGGFGHSYYATGFPGSKVALDTEPAGFAVARATSVCATDPGSPDCTSCAFAATCDGATEACKKIRTDSACLRGPGDGRTGPGFDGFYGPKEDNYNLRAFDMKRRFGLEARFPVSRYVAALTGKRVPNRESAHPESMVAGRRVIGTYTQAETCANPLLSVGLPEKEGDELCNLAKGPRTERQILFGYLGGTLPGKLGGEPNWGALVGRDPERFDFSGADPHMLASVEPRAGLTGADLPIGDNGADPIHGREWRTQNEELQYACTYPFAASVFCGGETTPCDCPRDGLSRNPPLCGGASNLSQLRGKATPGTRELIVAKALGDRAVIGSVCGGASEYRGFHEALAAKINAVPSP